MSKSEIVTRIINNIGAIPFVIARRRMADTFKSDSGLKHAYVSNIAMLLHDKYGIRNYETRNAAAEDIMNVVFH